MQILFILFLWTVPMGAVLFAIVWLVMRRTASQSRIWRAILCGITAFAITPSVLEICGAPFIVPASSVSLMLMAPDAWRRSAGLAFGVLPLVTFAAILFCAWSYKVEEKRKMTND